MASRDVMCCLPGRVGAGDLAAYTIQCVPFEGIFNRSHHLDIASLTFVALLSTTPSTAVPPAIGQERPLLAAVPLAPALAGSVRMVKVKSSSRDSLRNGTLIGLAVGGVLGFFAGA